MSGAARVCQVLLFDAAQLAPLCSFAAHQSALAALAVSACGAMVATASEKGTIIRVHAFPQVWRLQCVSPARLGRPPHAQPPARYIAQGAPLRTFRRGSTPASIHSLCFSPGVPAPEGGREASARLLCAASSTGTIHLWRLDSQRGNAAQTGAASAAAGRGAAAGASTMAESVAASLPLLSGERSFAQARLRALPAGASRYVASVRDAASVGGGDVAHALHVLTEGGAWYTYRVDGLSGGECELTDERRVVPPAP